VRSYRFGMIGALAAAGLMSVSLAAPAVLPSPTVVNESEVKRRRKAVAAGSLTTWKKRGRRAQVKRAKRPNRLIISKRVRRKHRRDARSR